MPLAQIAAITKDLEPLTGRLNTEPGPLGTTLINDALRANTESTRAGLAFLSEVESAGRRVAVLGEMGEIGDRAVEEHEGIGAFLPTLNLDQALCIGGLTEHIVRGALEKGFPADRIANVETVQEAAALLRDSLQPGDILYLKGSLLRHLERVKLILRGVEVGCAVRSCPFYHQCDGCDYRVAGYAGGEG
jgi:UDP-N-acetylmuramoyl-tripeptide--D-alanyl-D-alanine ligase